MEKKQWIKLLREKHKYKDHLSLTYVACGELAELLEHENDDGRLVELGTN